VKFEIDFNGASAGFGVLLTLMALGHLSWWWLLATPIYIAKLPGGLSLEWRWPK
jgi:hypothetical protein